METPLKTFKAVAKSKVPGMVEPFVDWFEAASREEAVEQWKAQAVACGIDLNDITLESMTEQPAGAAS